MDHQEQEGSKTMQASGYGHKEQEAVEMHIARYFGEYTARLTKEVASGMQVGICIIPPTSQRAYYILATIGMGAYPMHIPAELAQYKLERAEFLITLPPDWKAFEGEEQWDWPIRLLQDAARLPEEHQTWLGWGHTVQAKAPYADNTRLCGALLVEPQMGGEQEGVCALPDGQEVNFYQLIPLYQEELEFKRKNGAQALLERIADAGVSYVVNIRRPSVIDEDMRDFLENLIDGAQDHARVILQKHLPVDELAAYTHMAIYLRWCIEQDLMCDLFVARFADLVVRVKQGANSCWEDTDLRVFLRDEADLGGYLLLPYFNQNGMAFANWYYKGGVQGPYTYFGDLDAYAKKFFGEKRYESGEFLDAAYLFLPWSKECYEGIAEILSKRFREWRM